MTYEQALEVVRRSTARGLAIHGWIAEAERRAQERVRRQSSSPRNFGALMAALQTPGLRSARDFNSSGAFKMAPRPKAFDTGGVTFHFSVTSVSKTNRTVAAYADRSPSSRADQHERYIERDGAAEAFVDPLSRVFNQANSVGGQEYIEQSSASEEFDSRGSIILSSFGNIAATKEKRLEFWRKLEAFERIPRGHKFTINPFRGADFWSAVQSHASAGKVIPPPLTQAMHHCLSDVSPLDVTLKDEDAIALLKFAHAMGDFRTDGAIKVSLGRGGRVQTRIIGELPHEITPAQRLSLAKKYCAEFERLGLPYWAVIHAPDKHNDRRNVHIHITLSERPAKQLPHPATGQLVWDFEITETYQSKCRHVRTRHPYAQKRDRGLHDASWVKNERQRFCVIMNGELEASGSSKRYDPRSYAEMGLTGKAKRRIDPKIYAKERKGQLTEHGLEAARQQWETAIEDLHEECKKAAAIVVHASYRNRIILNALYSGGHPDTKRFQDLMRKAADLHSLFLSTIIAETAANFVADKIVSRPRLKKPAQRTKIDNFLIEVASEIRTTEAKQFRVVAEKMKAEYHATVSKITQIRNDYVRTFQTNLFNELVSRVASPAPASGQEPKVVKTPAERIAEVMASMEALEAEWFPKYKPLFDPTSDRKASETLKPKQSPGAEHPSLSDVFRSKPSESFLRQQDLKRSRVPAMLQPKPAPTPTQAEFINNAAAQSPSVTKHATSDGKPQASLNKPQQSKQTSNTIVKRPQESGPERSLHTEGAQPSKAKVSTPGHSKGKLQPPDQIPGNVPERSLDEEERKRRRRKNKDQDVTTKEKLPIATTSPKTDLQRLFMLQRMRDKGRDR